MKESPKRTSLHMCDQCTGRVSASSRRPAPVPSAGDADGPQRDVPELVLNSGDWGSFTELDNTDVPAELDPRGPPVRGFVLALGILAFSGVLALGILALKQNRDKALFSVSVSGSSLGFPLPLPLPLAVSRVSWPSAFWPYMCALYVFLICMPYT